MAASQEPRAQAGSSPHRALAPHRGRLSLAINDGAGKQSIIFDSGIHGVEHLSCYADRFGRRA
jgi:hypothetical protein